MKNKQGIRSYVKILLFLSSYIPLFVVLSLLHHTNKIFVIAMVIIIAATLVTLLLLFKASEMEGNYPNNIIKFENINNVGLEYIITYIFPFLSMNFSDPGVLLALLIMFLVIGYIYINSDLIYMNPMLNLFGYNIYKCHTELGNIIIISKRNIEEIKENKIIQLSDNVYLGR